MDRGDGSSGSPGFAEVALYVYLPAEIVTLVDVYRIHIRVASRKAAIKALLETHPALTSIAASLYAEVNNTSPP